MQSSKRAGLILLAPAKLNLTLEVLGKRDDGFHKIRSVLQTIELWDTIYMESLDNGVDFNCSQSHLERPDNLVLQAIEGLKLAQPNKGVSIRMQKGIPEAAGLGGGSSDAASTLKGLNYLWETNLPPEQLSSIASKLGSDAPFFITGGTSLAEGRGEIVKPLSPLPPHWAVILIPNIPVPLPKTAHLYSHIRPEHYTCGEHTNRLVEALNQNGMTIDISRLLFNVFESVAFRVYSGLAKYQEYLKEAGATSIHLAGSGPALFTLTPDNERATSICNNLKKKGLEVYIARTRN